MKEHALQVRRAWWLTSDPHFEGSMAEALCTCPDAPFLVYSLHKVFFWLWYTFTRKTSQICVNRTYTRVQGWTGCHEWFRLAISLEGFTACVNHEFVEPNCGQIVEDLKFVTTIQKFLLSSKHLLKIGVKGSLSEKALTFKDGQRWGSYKIDSTKVEIPCKSPWLGPTKLFDVWNWSLLKQHDAQSSVHLSMQLDTIMKCCKEMEGHVCYLAMFACGGRWGGKYR